MNHLISKQGVQDQVECDSAGTLGYHAGENPDPRMQQAMRKRGIPVRGKARKVRKQDLKEFDLILAMDRDNLDELYRLDRDEEYRDKVKLFGQYCRKTPGAEVPDPYYGGESGFEQVMDMLEDGCEQVLQELVEPKNTP